MGLQNPFQVFEEIAQDIKSLYFLGMKRLRGQDLGAESFCQKKKKKKMVTISNSSFPKLMTKYCIDFLLFTQELRWSKYTDL